MSKPPSGNGTLAYRVEQLEKADREIRKDIQSVRQVIVWLILAVVGATLTLTVSMIVLAVSNHL
jgi:hypothetical protein